MVLVCVWDMSMFKNRRGSPAETVRWSTNVAISSRRNIFARVYNVDAWRWADLLRFFTKSSAAIMRIGSYSVVYVYRPGSLKWGFPDFLTNYPHLLVFSPLSGRYRASTHVSKQNASVAALETHFCKTVRAFHVFSNDDNTHYSKLWGVITLGGDGETQGCLQKTQESRNTAYSFGHLICKIAQLDPLRPADCVTVN